MQIDDDLYLGNFSRGSGGPPPAVSGNADPTLNTGIGPMGRVFVYNGVPLTKQAANIAALQHTVASTALVLAAGTGATKTLAPDGSGRFVYAFDVPRAVSLTSTADFSGKNFTVSGFDYLGRAMTQLRAGPNNNTVNTTKAFASVLSVVPNGTDGANNVSVGSSDIFGLPYACLDAGYLIAKWASTLALDAGTFVAGVATDPATTTTGDPRGTYLPSSASDGAKRLVLWHHLTASQCGPNATQAGALGVAPV